ncbi:Alpha/Beta hydrolase protein [Aspergillus karnatakaensis]|uniref:alpha/beta hydrolase n=1 Tax=Aspergillus karnatakaensis TaxID=1810916 RepID=UPI003CCDD114
MADLTKLAGFDLIQEHYKFVGDHGIRADILVPQTNYSGPRPTIARFHGGGLAIADSLYMDWFPYWLSDLALEQEAVIISANYRLLPRSTSPEIYSDLQDFYKWLRSPSLEEVLASHSNPTELDLGHLLVTGESAGGLLSIQSALSHPHDIKASIAMYPMVDLKSPDFTEPRSIPPFGVHSEESLVAELLSTLPDEPYSSTSAEYLPLMLAAFEYGHVGDWYSQGVNETCHTVGLYPLQHIERKGQQIPKGGFTIIQGLNDTVVPAHHAVPFVKRAREIFKGSQIQYITREGEHGFDGNLRLKENGWLQRALGPVVEAWLN